MPQITCALRRYHLCDLYVSFINTGLSSLFLFTYFALGTVVTFIKLLQFLDISQILFFWSFWVPEKQVFKLNVNTLFKFWKSGKKLIFLLFTMQVENGPGANVL